MRRRLTLTVLAVTAMVTVAFLLPLAAVVKVVASDRALSVAEQEARSLAGVLASLSANPTNPELPSVVQQFNDDHSGRSVAVYLASGTRIGAPVKVPPSELALAGRGRSFTAASGGATRLWVSVRVVGGTVVGVVNVPDSLRQQGVSQAWVALAAVGAFVIVLALILADRLARSMVRAIEDLGEATRRLRSGDLQTRVRPAGPPEIAGVGQAVNDLADRIIELLALEREAAADLSHSLRTPLAALQLEADGLSHDGDRQRIGAAVHELTEAVNRVILEVRQARPVRGDATADLAAVARQRLAFWSVLAEEQDRTWSASIPDTRVEVGVAPEELAATVDALLGNVLAHTPEGVGFRVAVTPEGEGALLVIDDDGPGLASVQVTARGASGTGSTGLGLDIVRRTAESSRGRLTLAASATGGARLEVHLGGPSPDPAVLTVQRPELPPGAVASESSDPATDDPEPAPDAPAGRRVAPVTGEPAQEWPGAPSTGWS
jgi:signal transduction histidine kinase